MMCVRDRYDVRMEAKHLQTGHSLSIRSKSFSKLHGSVGFCQNPSSQRSWNTITKAYG